MYERKTQRLAPFSVFFLRTLYNIVVAALLLSACLSIGVLGFHFINGCSWIDALHNASMLLSGMGPVVEMKSDGAKLFSSFYALFSGVVFITNIGIILAPAAHRLFHRLHLQEDNGQ
jgi:hypothetical protein